MFERWRDRRREKAAAAAARTQRLAVIAEVKAVARAADPARLGPVAAELLAEAIDGEPGRRLRRSLSGTAPSALAELRASLNPATPADADSTEALMIAVDQGWDATSEPDLLMEAIQNWAEHVREPESESVESVLWLAVLVQHDDGAALADLRRRLGVG